MNGLKILPQLLGGQRDGFGGRVQSGAESGERDGHLLAPQRVPLPPADGDEDQQRTGGGERSGRTTQSQRPKQSPPTPGSLPGAPEGGENLGGEV